MGSGVDPVSGSRRDQHLVVAQHTVGDDPKLDVVLLRPRFGQLLLGVFDGLMCCLREAFRVTALVPCPSRPSHEALPFELTRETISPAATVFPLCSYVASAWA